MIIDYNSYPTTDIPNFKGGEKEIHAQMFFDGTNRIMRGILNPGATIGEHRHEDNCEVIFILEGRGTIVEDGAPHPIGPGQCTYCPKGHSHSLQNTGNEDLIFYCVVANQ